MKNLKSIAILLLLSLFTMSLIACNSKSSTTSLNTDEKTTTTTTFDDTASKDNDVTTSINDIITTTSNDDVTTTTSENISTNADDVTTVSADITTTTSEDITTSEDNTTTADDSSGDEDENAGPVLEDVTIDLTKISIECSSGTENAYSIKGSTITFSNIEEKTTYSISGELDGNIVIDVTEDYKFELEFNGLTLTSTTEVPIYIASGDKVTLSFKKGSINNINDLRDEVTNEDDISSSIYALCDISLQGKGTLNLTSTHNKGIHTKDDLEIKNLILNVECMDNALKGNDSITIESGTLNLISKAGDGIKTSNSDISSKGNQRGTVTISGGDIKIYAACDGIDASYDCIISGDTNLKIFTDKYSEYSLEVTNIEEDSFYYIRNTTNNYNYSIKYSKNNSDEIIWKNATYYTSQTVRSGRNNTTYYYYKIDKPAGYDKFTLFSYNKTTEVGQDTTYEHKTSVQTINDSYDTISLSGSRLSWTNYQTQSQPRFGQEGNTDKGTYSTKGIKADNCILISGGTIDIKSYDDAIHANNDNELENGETPLGNVTISGGTLSLYSNDDGIHADGLLTISGGKTNISYSYEGLEGASITISGGETTLSSKDDGVNSTNESGRGLTITGGYLYVYAGGDGLDSNTKTNYEGIYFDGGQVVVISTSTGNSCLDTERGYTYVSGSVIAMCPNGGMTSESINASNFSSIGTKSTISLSKDYYLSVKVENETVIALKIPQVLNAFVVYLGSNNASFSSSSVVTVELDSNGAYFK